MATAYGGISTDILQPNDWRVQLGQGQGLDGLGWTSYAMQQGNAAQPANPAYFKANVPGNTGLILVDAKNAIVYSYHPNFYPQAPQQGNISSLGLEPVYMQALELHVRAKMLALGMDPDMELAAKPLGDWLLLVVGLTILAIGIVLSGGLLAGLLPAYMLISLAAFGPLLVYTGIALTILGGINYTFGTTTTQTGANSWQNCSILSGCTSCQNNNGSVSCQPAGGGFDWTQIAEGVAVVVVVGVGGYVTYKVVQGHYAKKNAPQAYYAPYPYPPPPQGPTLPRPVSA